MTYRESVQLLYALGNEVQTAKLGLDRISTLLEALGGPHRRGRFAHVAGTNGKGSTCAMIEAGLRVAGVHTGLYTSPHLSAPTERIRIAGEPVGEPAFAAAFAEVHAAARDLLRDGRIDLHPTYFETVTAMAFLLFERAGVEIVALEVGLGGRLDATNVVTPAVCVITPVDYDHQAYLGHTLESIAGEKAGILKPGVPAIFARQRADVRRVLESRARSLNAPFTLTSEWPLEAAAVEPHGNRIRAGGLDIECPLAGEHQIENALAAAMALGHLGFGPRGIATTKWPGRLERVSREPEIILDGAHNLAGAAALASYIRRFFEGKHVWMVYGAMRDKAVAETAALLFPLAARVLLAAPDSARAMTPEEIRALAPRGTEMELHRSVADAVARARAAPPDATVFVTGSLFVVGEARACLAA